MLSTADTRLLRVGVVMPAYNEALHIAGVVAQLPAWIDRVVIVDDASTDDTAAVADGLANDRVQVTHHAANTGVGGAMCTGYEAALKDDCDVVVKMDADGQMEV